MVYSLGTSTRMIKDAKHFISHIAQVEKGKIQSAVSDSRFMSIIYHQMDLLILV